MTKLLAFAASYRTPSLNKQLLGIAVNAAKEDGAEVTVVDYQSFDAPVYKGEEMVDALPPGAEHFSRLLASHDGMLLATPEYNWSIPGALKNLIDWISIDPRAPLNNKTALLMCATPSMRSGVSGLQQLRTPLEVLGTWVYPQLICIGKAPEQMRGDHLAREADQQHLKFCVTDFIRATHALAAK